MSRPKNLLYTYLIGIKFRATTLLREKVRSKSPSLLGAKKYVRAKCQFWVFPSNIGAKVQKFSVFDVTAIICAKSEGVKKSLQYICVKPRIAHFVGNNLSENLSVRKITQTR